MNIDKHELENGIGELRAFVGTLRYLVEKCRPEDGECDVFFCLANAAAAIHAKLDNCFGNGNGGNYTDDDDAAGTAAGR